MADDQTTGGHEVSSEEERKRLALLQLEQARTRRYVKRMGITILSILGGLGLVGWLVWTLISQNNRLGVLEASQNQVVTYLNLGVSTGIFPQGTQLEEMYQNKQQISATSTHQ